MVAQIHIVTVFSTYVEVILSTSTLSVVQLGFLHVCGGDPDLSTYFDHVMRFSPRMWRWSYDYAYRSDREVVFSTYVEVILRVLKPTGTLLCFLHVCGGDPEKVNFANYDRPFSPRMWRWSCGCTHKELVWLVFSTYVEVILTLLGAFTKKQSFLHVCGGDPTG